MPKVSVIVPVYNVEKYLVRCLDSLKNQTLTDIEIICINDGSTDSSAGILEEYSASDSRFKIITQENKGLSVARNKGIELSTGEYIAFVDSDDWVSEDFLEKLYDAAIRNDADIAVAGILYHRKNKVKPILEFKKEHITEDYETKLDLCDVPTYGYVWNKIYRRSLKDTTLHFAEGRIYEDVMITPVLLYYSKNIVCVPGPVYNYFRHKNTVVKIKNEKSKNDYIFAQETIHKFFKEHGIDVSKIGTQIKKYRFFGVTVFKVIYKKDRKEYILLNCVKWERAN